MQIRPGQDENWAGKEAAYEVSNVQRDSHRDRGFTGEPVHQRLHLRSVWLAQAPVRELRVRRIHGRGAIRRGLAIHLRHLRLDGDRRSIRLSAATPKRGRKTGRIERLFGVRFCNYAPAFGPGSGHESA